MNGFDVDGRFELPELLLFGAVIVIGAAIAITAGVAFNRDCKNIEEAAQNLDFNEFYEARQTAIFHTKASLIMADAGINVLNAGMAGVNMTEKVGGNVTAKMSVKFNQNLSKGAGGYLRNIPGTGNRIISKGTAELMTKATLKSVANQTAPKVAFTFAKGASKVLPEVVETLFSETHGDNEK